MSDQDKIHAIYNALVGNKELGHVGLVEQVGEMRKDVDGLKKWRDAVKIRVAMVTTGLSLFWSTAWEWFHNRMSGGGGHS